VVEAPEQLAEALQMARGEARSAFGDDRLLLEKYLARPRHVEVQIFADDHGGAIYLGDRDCSIQRRHQKIVEEAPAPGLSDELRRQMGEAAVRAAQAIDYRNAGTVEFLLDEDGRFYFMEMNTRLQVEHPVTELVTGQDLVKWQLQVAGGEPLPLTQADVHIHGHAIEARVYAEDPDSEFMPQAGRIAHLAEPAPSRHVRIDSGVREGDEISSYYDPMIAKLICWDERRPLAVRRINRALEEYRVVGVKTNLPFLANVLDSRPFVSGQLSTKFIEENRDLVLAVNAQSPLRFLALGALFLLERGVQQDRSHAQGSPDPHSPWFSLPTWRLNGPSGQQLRLLDLEGGEHLIGVTRAPRGYRLEVDGQAIRATAQLVDHQLFAELDGHALKATITHVGSSLTVQFRQHTHQFTLPLPPTLTDEESALGELTAPINGVVVSVHCQAGDEVARGATLMVIEAMKMQYSITAPTDGVVKEVPFAVGDQVVEGQPLLVLDGDAA